MGSDREIQRKADPRPMHAFPCHRLSRQRGAFRPLLKAKGWTLIAIAFLSAGFLNLYKKSSCAFVKIMARKIFWIWMIQHSHKATKFWGGKKKREPTRSPAPLWLQRRCWSTPRPGCGQIHIPILKIQGRIVSKVTDRFSSSKGVVPSWWLILQFLPGLLDLYGVWYSYEPAV